MCVPRVHLLDKGEYYFRRLPAEDGFTGRIRCAGLHLYHRSDFVRGLIELFCNSKKENFSHYLMDLRLVSDRIRTEIFVQSSIEIGDSLMKRRRRKQPASMFRSGSKTSDGSLKIPSWSSNR